LLLVSALMPHSSGRPVFSPLQIEKKTTEQNAVTIKGDFIL
jgi:hypothetical protein